ncbi:hypothetical protein [Lysobacter gummosus]|uniref:hypothetical protein n=1 Tax=Lysobacter gummosus TaxID=262324 RepID=UPI00362C9616
MQLHTRLQFDWRSACVCARDRFAGVMCGEVWRSHRRASGRVLFSLFPQRKFNFALMQKYRGAWWRYAFA